jgi:hypothetical protein
MPKKNAPMTVQFRGGMPGLIQYIGFMGRAADREHPLNKAAIGGGPGLYKVVLTLARPGYPLHPECEYSTFETLEGDSHLAIAKPACVHPEFAPDDDVEHVILSAQTDDGVFQLYGTPNSRGYLARVTAESIQADTAQDARIKVSRALASSLSNISIQLDMPLWVYQADMVELSTGNRFVSIISPIRESPMLVAPQGVMTKEFRANASLYREALNSNTPVFQFLCFFKIIEALLARRERTAVEAKARGETPSRPVQIVPTDEKEFIPWLSTIYHVGRDWDEITLASIFVPEARGKKFTRIIEDYLRPVRVRIAHAVLDSGELTLSADEEMDIQQVYKWLAQTRCIVRHMLKSDFPTEFLAYIADDGSMRY